MRQINDALRNEAELGRNWANISATHCLGCNRNAMSVRFKGIIEAMLEAPLKDNWVPVV